MKVAIDTHCLYVTRAGTARYTRGLLGGLQRLGAADLDLTEIVWPVENLAYRQPERALKTVFRELIWARWIAPSLLRKRAVDILHRADPSMPIPHPRTVREVVTLHDLAVLRQRGRFRRWQQATARHRLTRLRRADQIICVSQFTADEAMRLLGIPARQIDVVHHGVEFCSSEADGSTLQIPSAFFLFVGSLEPGKNLKLLRECYLLAESRGTHLPPLLIVGSRWAGVGTEGRAPKNWRYLDHQPDPVLAVLYRRAIALLFPSQYEGFGFPLLEAMARGCPVVCGRVASLPEIGGEAADYVELEPESFLRAIRRLETDHDWRNELILRGYAQSASFTWEKCAQETLAVYARVLK